MWWRAPHNPTAYDDDWEGQPTQGVFYQWGLGVLLPLLLLSYGLLGVIHHEIDISGRGTSWQFHNSNAVAFGLAWMSAAVFLHCHYFWGNLRDQAWFAVLGKIVAACGFIAGLGYVLVRNGVLGVQ